MNWKDHTNHLVTQSAILQMLLRGDCLSKRLYKLSILIYAKKKNQEHSHHYYQDRWEK